jgi:hypothetical protein
MNKLLSVFAALLTFTFVQPANAKSFWLKCGMYVINLDSDKERYSMQIDLLKKVYQGPAVFNPQQINFEVIYTSLPNGGGTRFDFGINRKTLDYERKSLVNVVLGFGTDKGWETIGLPQTGKCSFVKNPTEGNKI